MTVSTLFPNRATSWLKIWDRHFSRDNPSEKD
jgi:hypothetical protein